MSDTDTREALRKLLRDENGLAPTENATDVIMAVIRETIRTDEEHDTEMSGNPTPTLAEYAIDAERALRILRKYQR